MRDEAKWEFVHSQVLSNCIASAFQRAGVYDPSAGSEAREQLRRELRNCLVVLEDGYRQLVGHEQHLANIVALSDNVSRQCEAALSGKRFRIGVAQKALNLLLKYLWCLGRIPEPPHCPFDSRIISQLPDQSGVLWTRLDDPRQYEALVASAKQKAGSRSLAEWELDAFGA